MYTLSFYEGSSELSFAIGRRLFKFPYTYSKNLFSSSFTKEQFYKDIFNLAAKELGESLDNCEIYTTGVLDHPKVPFKVEKSACILTSLPENYVYVNNYMIAMKNVFRSFTPLSFYEEEDNLFANMNIFKNIVYSDTFDINVKDKLLRAILASTQLNFSGNGVVLTGDRFINFNINTPLSYLLVFDIIRQPGIFYVKLDKRNFLPHMMLLSYEEEFFSLGTLVNSPGETECLYETEVGTSQLITLEPDKLFILPLEAKNEARILVKSSSGQIDQKVIGGELGVVIDTRSKTEGFEFKEVGVDAIIQALNRI